MYRRTSPITPERRAANQAASAEATFGIRLDSYRRFRSEAFPQQEALLRTLAHRQMPPIATTRTHSRAQ
ncbi:hypothetical protein D9M69_716360 [compost metagenome]